MALFDLKILQSQSVLAVRFELDVLMHTQQPNYRVTSSKSGNPICASRIKKILARIVSWLHIIKRGSVQGKVEISSYEVQNARADQQIQKAFAKSNNN